MKYQILVISLQYIVFIVYHINNVININYIKYILIFYINNIIVKSNTHNI